MPTPLPTMSMNRFVAYESSTVKRHAISRRLRRRTPRVRAASSWTSSSSSSGFASAI